MIPLRVALIRCLEDTLAFPLQSTCLSTLASISRHGIDTSSYLLELDGIGLALRYATHLEDRVRCSALRLLARLIPYAAQLAWEGWA